jgi:heat shock protein HslJ
MKAQCAARIIVGSVLVLSTCATTARAQQDDAALDLGKHAWQLVAIRGGDQPVLAPQERSKYVLEFGDDGSLTARIDCNRGHGVWTSPGAGQIELGPLALTRAMCPPGSLHDQIVSHWGEVRSYTLRDGHLILSLASAGGEFELEPTVTATRTAEPGADSFKDDFPAQADVIWMKSGSVLVGKLSGANLGVVEFKIAGIGDTEIKAKEIARIRASNADFQVDVDGRGRIVGKIRPDVAAGNLLVATSNGDIVVPFSQAGRLKRIDQTLAEKLDGYVGVGYSYTSDSGVRRLNLNQYLTYATTTYRVFNHFTLIDTRSQGSGSTDRIDAGLGYLYGINGDWLLLQYLRYQKIPSTGVSDRWVSVSGAGRRIVHNHMMDLNLLAGIAFQKEYDEDGTASDIQTEVPVVLDFALGLPPSGLKLGAKAIYYDSLSISGRYRMDAQVDLAYEVFANFKIGVQYLYNYDSKPMDPTAANSDRSTTFSVGYTF